MAMVILVTGGSRSGKSAFAQDLAESLPGKRFFLATCPHTDAEMSARIRRHQADRQAGVWQTIEEPLRLAEVLGRCPAGSVVLLDCLTLWISNLLHAGDREEQMLGEDQVEEECRRLLAAADQLHTLVMVTNEVGSGIVPENALARRYRDLVGRCNQCMGRAADQVHLVVCGVPLRIR